MHDFAGSRSPQRMIGNMAGMSADLAAGTLLADPRPDRRTASVADGVGPTDVTFGS